ncbi:MAG: cytidylyltransferase domain-containing protein [Ferrovibrio sp.]
MRCLGLINARGGSKGIPGKNIKPLLGKPLVAYSIEAGLVATRIDRVVVSTDSPEIAAVARQYGAEVPFMRPAELATDKALQIDAIRHAILKIEESGERYDVVVILQPTCPLRLPEDIDGALALMEASEADTVISVMEVHGQHPLTMYTEDPDGSLRSLMGANGAGVLRQEFSRVLWRNGAIYAIRRDVIINQNVLYGAKVRGYLMPETRSANIDEPVDWVVTEALLRFHQEGR